MPLSQLPAFGSQAAKSEYQVVPNKEYMSKALDICYTAKKNGLSK
jgi:hypothetical protein